MGKKKETEEKAVDAVVTEETKEDDVLTTQNEEDGKALKEEEEKADPEIKSPPATAPIEDGLEDEDDEGPPSMDEKINAFGVDARTIGPEYVVVNRAAILFLAKLLMTPPDLEDFKTLFPSLF